MAFLSGLLLIDCPASALNNAGKDEDANTDNATGVKAVKAKDGVYPYVSAQAFRYWLRETVKKEATWTATPIFREGKIAYTDANPIKYAEDDLFGYMRAPSKKSDAAKKRTETGLLDTATSLEDGVTLTRHSPFKVSTLISIAPLKELTRDFGVMARHEGDPVPYEHQLYRTTLQGLFSLDLAMTGRFYHIQRTGFKHLDAVRIQLAEEMGLAQCDDGKAYELPLGQRLSRIATLLKGIATINGGAKQAIHYTDVSPKFCILAVAKGGNHLFSTSVTADSKGKPEIKLEAVKEIARVYKDELLSGIYVGLSQGYLDGQRKELEEALRLISSQEEYGKRITFIGHPIEAINAFLDEMGKERELWLS
ncbi:MAG: type I-B CRISPR-associated protein Cas7/Cst2/DevR [Veillonellaceae bacterium]|jgi:CRISPR-associated protein Cst2|nr:type I-B CRISPR-associated protein Cas7/Cst2/DevR [Veillonellaceae bacterium]